MADEIEPVEAPEAEAPEPETPAIEAVETEVPVETPDPAAPPETDYVALLKEKSGVDFSKYKSNDELFKGIGELAKRVGQKSELERQGEQYQRWLAQQQAQVEQPVQAQPPAPVESNLPWNPPEVRQTDRLWVEKDPESGVSRIKPDAPDEVKQRLNAFAAYHKEYLYNLENNPQAILQPWAEQIRQQAVTESEQRILAFLQQREMQQQQFQTLNNIKSQREKQIFQFGASGNRLTDPSGVPSVTEYGRHYVIKVKELEARGIHDPGTQDYLAHEFADLQMRLSAAPGTKPAPTPKPGHQASKNTAAPSSKGAPAKTSLAEMLLADNEDVSDDAIALSFS